MSAMARRSCSTNVTCAAPRLIASIPTAPVPANPSSTRAPSILGARMLNNVSRSLSDVGRNPSQVGAFRRRPLRRPAIMRTAASTPKSQLPTPNHSQFPIVHNAIHWELVVGSVWELGVVLWELTSADLNQSELILPLLRDERVQLRCERPALHERPRLMMGQLHDVAIADEIAGAQLRESRLPRAEEISGAAQLEIAFRNHEAIGGGRHRLQALARIVGPRRLIQQDAHRLRRTAADAAAQLVQLRQPESLRMLDDHDRRVRHVDADLDDS